MITGGDDRTQEKYFSDEMDILLSEDALSNELPSLYTFMLKYVKIHNKEYHVPFIISNKTKLKSMFLHNSVYSRIVFNKFCDDENLIFTTFLLEKEEIYKSLSQKLVEIIGKKDTKFKTIRFILENSNEIKKLEMSI